MDILDIFRDRGQSLFWRRIDDDQIDTENTGESIGVEEDYFVVRLTRMYLSNTRKLWRKFYPVVHGFTSYAGVEEHAVVGPGQLADVADVDLDRVLVLN